MSKYLRSLAIPLVAFCLSVPAMAEKLGLGRAALPAEITAWDWDINAMGDGLPVGSGDVLDGEEIFAESVPLAMEILPKESTIGQNWQGEQIRLTTRIR